MRKGILEFSPCSIEHAGFRIAAWILVVLALVAQDTHAAWHDDHPGDDLVVHYVYLTGYDGNNDVNRRNLLIEYQACIDRHAAFGQASNPLPPGGIPSVVVTEDIELYYSSNRVLRVSQSKIYFIDQAACDLTAKSKRMLELNSVIGRCNIDLNTKKAIGACDEKAQEQAPNSTLAKIAPAKMPPIDLDKLPPKVRAQVAAQLDRLNRLPQGPAGLYGAALLPTGGYKTIAKYKCASYRADALHTELCIAHPKSDFPIPASLMNGGIPGLLLDVDTPAMTLHAQEVKMDMAVSKSIFAIPAGIKVTNIRVPRERP